MFHCFSKQAGWSKSCDTIKVCEMKLVFQFICQLLKQQKKGLSS